MTPERWREIKAAFEAVDSAPPEERTALLNRLCEGNDTLRRDLEQLMQAGSGTSDEVVGDLVGAEAAYLAGTSEPAPVELNGRMMGPYRVEQLLGSGGMGEVYMAQDSRLGRQVALKVLPSAYAANAERIRRFQQEARAASALNHPNIVTIHDFGKSEGLYYMATEFVRGKTLRAVMAAGAMEPRQVAQIAVQVAGALAAAHEAGIVHRDIKPENIMQRPDGYIKVLDFGLAKLREPSVDGVSAATLTRTGTIMGTTAYMSPEQLRGLPVDAQSDIFSLGVVLYEMVAGQTPFKGKTGADQIAAVLEHDPQPVAGVLPALQAIIDRCLRKDRQQRYQSTQALVDDLKAFQQDVDSVVSRPRQQVPSRTSGKRLAFIMTALAAVVGLGLVFGSRWWFADPQWYRSSRLSAVPRDEHAGGGIVSPTGRYLAYVNHSRVGLEGIRVRLLTAAQAIDVVPPQAARHYGFAISPDENFLYYTVDHPGEKGVLFRVPLLGGSPQKILADVGGIVFSPDGTKIAFRRQVGAVGSLWIAEADGSGERRVTDTHEYRPFYTFAWSADGKQLFYTEGTHTANGLRWSLWSVSAAGGQAARQVIALDRQIMAMTVLPDGSGFAANAIDPESRRPQIWHLTKTGKWSAITHDLNEYQGLSITADGHRLATIHAERQTELWVIDAADPSRAARITDTQLGFGFPVWSLHGGIISMASGSGSNTNLWNMARDGSAKRLLPVPGSTSDSQPAACPDRDEIVFVSQRKNTYSIWRLRPDGSEVKQLTFGVSDLYPQCLAGGVVKYRSQLGKEIRTLQVPLDGGTPGPIADTRWDEDLSADGKLRLVSYSDAKTHRGHLAVKSRSADRTLIDFEGDSGVLEPSGKGVAYVSRQDDLGEIWYQPMEGGAARKLTRFGDRMVFSLDWSRDGRSLVCAVGRITTSLVLIDDIR